MNVPNLPMRWTPRDVAGSHPDGYEQQDRGTVVMVVAIVATSLSTLFVFARFFARKVLMGSLHPEDYPAMLSVLLQWTYVALTILAIQNGYGRHMETLTVQQQEASIYWVSISFSFGITAFIVPKFAVVLLLIRVTYPGPKQRFFLWFLVCFCLLAVVINLILFYVQCLPVRAKWDFSVTDAQCFSKWVIVNFSYFSASLSAVTDLYLAIYPAVILFGLSFPLRKKLWLSAALGIGAIGAIVAIYKCTQLPSIASDDFTYATTRLVMWTTLEGSTILIACCIPVLQPIADLVRGRRTFRKRRPHYIHRSPTNVHHGPANTEATAVGARSSDKSVRLESSDPASCSVDPNHGNV